MDQKDNGASTPMKKLASAQDLRGKKSGSGVGSGKKRKLWVPLLCVLLLLGLSIGAYYASGIFKPEQEPEPESTYENTTVKLIAHSRSEIDSVTIQLPDETPYTILCNTQYDTEGNALSLEDGQAAYSIKGMEAFDLDQSLAQSITGYAANLTATKMIAENTTDLSAYGLDKPVSTMTCNYRDGTSTTWLIGSKAPTSTGSYFSEKGSKAVFLVYQSAVSTLTTPLLSLHTVNMPWSIADTSTIQRVIIEADGKDTIEIGTDATTADNYSISALKLLQPFVYAANSDRVDTLYNNLIALTIDSYAGELGELTDTGLEEGAYRYKIGITVAPDTLKPEETVYYDYRVGNFASSNQVYVQIDDTNAVYLTSSSNVSFLDNATPGNLVDQFSNLIFINRVESLTIKTADDEWTLSIDHQPRLDENGNDTGKTDDTFYFDGKETDETLFKKLYQEIIGTMSSKLSDDYYLDTPVYCSVTYDLNVEPNTLTIDYLTYNDDYLAVRRDGVTMFLIKRENIDRMITAVQQYREGTFVPKD